MTDITDKKKLNQQAMTASIVDFNGKSKITKAEFSAWLAGYLGRSPITELTPECVAEIIAIVLKIEEPTKYVQSPNQPWPDQTKPVDPYRPFNPPMFPGPGIPGDPVNPTVPWPNIIWYSGDSGTQLDVSYKLTSGDGNIGDNTDNTDTTGSTDGS